MLLLFPGEAVNSSLLERTHDTQISMSGFHGKLARSSWLCKIVNASVLAFTSLLICRMKMTIPGSWSTLLLRAPRYLQSRKARSQR